MIDTRLCFDDVIRAAGVLQGVAHRTPVLTSRTLDAAVGQQVFLKTENLQRSGTFKFRGAYHAMARLGPAAIRRGVCTVSSGNHAQAVALAASLLGVPAVVLMPDDAPAAKEAAVRGYGADVVLYDRQSMPQWQAGELLQQERGLPFISSHDHPDISAGAGTAAIELLDDAGPLDVLVAPVGGGGGMAGYATVMRARCPDAEVIAVEPGTSGLLAASLAAGERVERSVPATIADGMALTRIGELPFAVLRERVDRVVGVTDDEIRQAMTFLFERLKLVVEPSGAAALAAVLSGAVAPAGRRIGVVVSGGNVGAAAFSALLTPAPAPAHRSRGHSLS